MSILIAAATH